MSGTLALTALLMGLAGGPHCAAMCGPACAGVVRFGPAPAPRSLWQFQAGRLIGYSLAGAAAAQAVGSLAWLTAQTSALRPVWTLFHLAVLFWGASLLVLARQPAFAGGAARAVWSRVRPLAAARGGVFTAGVLWALMPCGLLYSALLVASLSGTAPQGALSMALFAVGSGASLALVPKLLDGLRERKGRAQEWAMRASGLLLVLAAGWALWIDLSHRIAVWCGLA